MNKAQTLSFTLTIFLSAYLLFVVQPIVGKVILPVLGGTPSVWNTTMMFFQLLLLGGYLYAHAISKIKSIKFQFATHIGLIVAAGLTTLPMATTIIDGAEPTSNLLLWQLGIMGPMIGLPFLFLSATAPLLQKWFSQTNHPDANDPYFLYASSNIGSVLALILYPVLVERFLPLPDQSKFWTYGYGGLLFMMALSAALSHKNLKAHTKPENDFFSLKDENSPNRKTIFLWLMLSFVPSSLMLGYTSFITSDIGSLPLFWVIPLTLYILSFVIAFAKKPLIPLPATRATFAILSALLFALMGNVYFLKLELGLAIGILFFVTAIMCHQELVRLKPSPQHLTLFYLIMSCGGALGGLFNALIAPLVFVKSYEFIITMLLSLFCWNLSASLKPSLTPKNKESILVLGIISVLALASFLILKFAYGTNYQLALPVLGILAIPLIMILMDRRPYFIAACAIFILATPVVPWTSQNKIVDISRNYFGTLTTSDNEMTRTLSHGITLHGAQPLNPEFKTIPLTYYNPKTAIGQAFGVVKDSHNTINAAGLGLGTGSVACLLRKGDHISFYEIDPDIIRIASDPKIFSYLSDCPSQSEIILGDARLKLKNATAQGYDLLLVDVFSSDSIPMHLITKEAAELYLEKIKPDGLVIFHISSRSFRLGPEVGKIAETLGISAYSLKSQSGNVEGTPYSYDATEAVVLTTNKDYIKKFESLGWKKLDPANLKAPWTDSYVNPLRSIHFRMHK